MKYVLYARKSTEDDDGQILSIEAQIFGLKEFDAKAVNFSINFSIEKFTGMIYP